MEWSLHSLYYVARPVTLASCDLATMSSSSSNNTNNNNNNTNRRRPASTAPLQLGAPVPNRVRTENGNNNNNNNQINIEEIIAAERARAQQVNMPIATTLVMKLDNRTGLTSTNYLFCGWRNGHVFDTITGICSFVFRGPTQRRSFDRCDLRLNIGIGTDLQCIAVYAYDGCAALLATPTLNSVVTLTMLTVVEQEGDRTRWNGTVPFVLRFTRASSLAIGIQNNNNNNVDVQVA